MGREEQISATSQQDTNTKNANIQPEGNIGQPGTVIRNRRFVEQVDEATKLKQFLFQEKVVLSNEQLGRIDLGDLNNVAYKDNGREPTLTEWKELDEKYSALISCLDLPLRRKIRIKELGFFFGQLPIILLATCALLTIVYLVFSRIVNADTFFGNLVWVVVLMGWTIAQGALGACAFLGTSVIATRAVEVTSTRPSDARVEPRASTTSDEIDVTDLNVLKIRVVSGALFAFLIGFLFSAQALTAIWKQLYDDSPNLTFTQVAVVFLPFIVGFSTSFVLSVLNRIITSLQILLGMTSRIQ